MGRAASEAQGRKHKNGRQNGKHSKEHGRHPIIVKD